MSLLNRAHQQNQNNQQQNQQNQQNQPTPFGRGRLPGANNNNNNRRPSPFNRAQRPAAPPKPFNGNGQMNSSIVPVHTTVVSFSMDGLGDPFYKLLGHDLNTDYGETKAVIKALESGGEAVDDLNERLEAAWDGYNLDGALLMYPQQPAGWGIVLNAPLMPNADDDDDEYDDDDDNNNQQNEPLPPAFKRIRALDPALVINVLARSRSQVLVMKAPMVHSNQYLSRTLYTDDPRLVAIARATGCMEET